MAGTSESDYTQTMNTPNMVFHDFWATRFYGFPWPEHGKYAAKIIQYLYELRDQQQTLIDSGIAANSKSAQGLFESKFDLLEHDQPDLRKLRQFIHNSVQQAVSHVNGEKYSPDRIDVTFKDSWYHITNDGGFHDTHVHGGCSWCGIYYLQIGDSATQPGGAAPNGGNRFYSPLMAGGAHGDYGNAYLRGISVDPPLQNGMLLLFPSYLKHSGLPYNGDADRVIISFNSCSYLKKGTGARPS